MTDVITFDSKKGGSFDLPLPDAHSEWLVDCADLEGVSLRFYSVAFDCDGPQLKQVFDIVAQKPERANVRFHRVEKDAAQISETIDLDFVAE